MKNSDKYSNEHISAFIDGELDSDERTLLLLDVQEDIVLAQRINNARILKEKVQLAYADLPDNKSSNKSFNCPAFVNKPFSLVAGLLVLITATALAFHQVTSNDNLMLARQLIENTTPLAPESISKAIGNNKRIIINISSYQPDRFDNTIDHLETLLESHSSDSNFNVEIVANKTGLKALDTTSSVHAKRISQLESRFDNFDVVACAKSMAKLASEGYPIQLMDSIMITPSAAEQVAKRTANGWLYLKL